MNVASIMYQTSNSKGQELVAQRMVKFALRLGHRALLVTSIFHDGEEVVSERSVELTGTNYVLLDRDPRVGLPTARVASYRATWPPRRIVFRDFVTVLRNLDREVGLDLIVTHSTLWNGPEEAAKWITWKRLLRGIGEDVKKTVFGHMSHYQPPDPRRYSPIERAYRLAWNSTALPAIFKAADLIVCVTPAEAEDMVSMGARPETIHIFPGGLDDDLAAMIDRADPSLALDKFKIPRGVPLVTYLGTIEERKNPLGVLRVARLMRGKGVHFVVAGRPGDQWEQVAREARKLDNVTVTGELSDEEKASLIKASRLNIILSRMEALGLTQLEFMYAGVPVVTSGVYGQKWLVRDGVDGVHVAGPDDAQGAAKAIEALIRDDAKWEEMSKSARERAKSFMFSKLMAELVERARGLLSV